MSPPREVNRSPLIGPKGGSSTSRRAHEAQRRRAGSDLRFASALDVVKFPSPHVDVPMSLGRRDSRVRLTAASPFRGSRPGRPDTARSTSALVAVMDLPPSAAPRRRAPPQGRLCGRSPASSERRRGASLVAVPAGAPVSVARPQPRPKGTTAPGKPAPCGSRASPDPGRRPSTRRTVRPRRGPGAGGTRRQPSPARPAVAAYGISPRSRCGLPEPRHCIGKRGRPVHNPEPDMAGFAPQRSVVHLGATTWVQTSAGNMSYRAFAAGYFWISSLYTREPPTVP